MNKTKNSKVKKKRLKTPDAKKNKKNSQLQTKKKRVRKKYKKEKISNKEMRKLKAKANVIFLVFGIFFMVIILSVLKLEITHEKGGRDMRVVAKEQSQFLDVIDAQRGSIYDAQGNPLAVNIKEYKMIAHLDPEHEKYDTSQYIYVPDYIENPVEDAKTIVKILGYEDDAEATEFITAQLLQDPSEKKQVEFGKYGNAISLEEKNELELSGVKGLEFIERENRYYPYGDFASYIIGYAKQYIKGEDNDQAIEGLFSEDAEDGEVILVGELGIEKLLNSYLEGEDGETKGIHDKQGVLLEEPQVVKQKTDGTSVYLTIDSTIQSYVHDFMTKYTKDQKFTNATTVVLDADTGAVLAGEKSPSYDPNEKDIKDYQDPFLETCQEPGSVIKTFLVAEAIKEDRWYPDKTFASGIRTDTDWGKKNNGSDNYVADWVYNEDGRSWGTITLEQAYYFSSNVGMTYLLDDVGYNNFVKTMKEDYEFGVPIQNQLYQSAACTYDPKYNFEIATTTFGQGMTANVMQILRAYTTFSGDGRMVNPYLIKSIEDSETGEVIYEGKSDKPDNWEVGEGGVNYDEKEQMYYKQILTEEENDEILDLMKDATYYNKGGDFQGTGASYGRTTKYEVGTKTGTAEVAVNGNYNNLSRFFSVVIMAPIEDPEIIVYTSVLNPQSSYPQGYMSQYTGLIIDNTLDYLLGETANDIEYDNSTEIVVDLEDYKKQKIEDAKIKLEEENLNYKIVGGGNVLYQYPMGNSKIDKSQKIYLIGNEVQKEDFVGLSKNDMLGFCMAQKVVCNFEGTGVVGQIQEDQENTNYYNIILEEVKDEKKN